MKKIIALIIIGLYSNSKLKAQDNFVGNWITEDSLQIINIYVEDSNYYGKIIYKRVTHPKDTENKIVLIQMKKRGNKKILYGGTYFDWNIKKEYEAKLILKDTNTIYFIGYFGIFNINKVWYRVQ